jgi:DNA-binding MarR family transcriptional regulator
MKSGITVAPDRSKQVEYVSNELLPRVALLTRLLVRQLGGELSRSEVGVLNTLSAGPRRITKLAELEGLAQPTMTILVKQLETQGLVKRERQADDGRVVLACLTDSGTAALGEVRAQASAVLRSYLAEMSDEQIDALAATTDTLQALVILLQRGAIT